ncbi:MAG: DUF983 domain-containing protein [Pseudomonadota bacterium]
MAVPVRRRVCLGRLGRARPLMQGNPVPDPSKGQSGLLQAALFGLCPNCGAPTLFEAPARVAGQCPACGQELAALERGGRLAGLLTIAVAALLITAAITVEELLRPPLWLQVIVWAPLTVAAVLGGLRLFKTASVYQEFMSSQP